MFSSNGIATGLNTGQKVFTAPGTWVVPAGVSSISVVAVGEGAGGGSIYGGFGGNLRYRNNIAVNPGDVLTAYVGSGANGTTDSTQNDGFPTTLKRNGVQVLNTSQDIGNDSNGGGNGGPSSYGMVVVGPNGQCLSGGGGGGAGGYAGTGGTGAGQVTSASGGVGGSGGGGNVVNNSFYQGGVTYGYSGKGGGGVGLKGQGASGNAGGVGSEGQGGSGGTSGDNTNGGTYGGGGGGGAQNSDGSVSAGSKGGPGALRIIWGAGRAFPSTMTGDM